MKIVNPVATFKEGGSVHRFWQRTAGVRQYLALDKSLNRLVARGIDNKTARNAISLFRHWGAELDQAGESYLRSCLTELEDTKGSVLIAGAGPMTMAMGAINHGSEDERRVYCFDQSQQWIQMLRSKLRQYEISNTFLITAAPALHQNIVRYRVDTKRLPKDFGLILCEGSNGTPTSAVSTLKHFGNLFAPSFRLLASNVNVDKDGPAMMRWAESHGARFVVVDRQIGFIKISRQVNQPEKVTGTARFQVADIVPAVTNRLAKATPPVLHAAVQSKASA